MSNAAEARDAETGRFLTGNKGGGRPLGARNKLGEAFIEALHESFIEHGATAIQTVIDEKPEQYLKVIASLCPKDLNLTVNNDAENMSDDEIRDRIRRLASRLAPFVGGIGDADCGSEAQAGAAVPPQLH